MFIWHTRIEDNDRNIIGLAHLLNHAPTSIRTCKCSLKASFNDELYVWTELQSSFLHFSIYKVAYAFFESSVSKCNGEALEQVLQKSYGCPIPGDVHGQAGCGSEHPGLVKHVPAHGQEIRTWWSLRVLPTQAIPQNIYCSNT